ncbi:hypothetical protein LEMLEM_LOCUS5696, partial [Lemmus lemmus]
GHSAGGGSFHAQTSAAHRVWQWSGLNPKHHAHPELRMYPHQKRTWTDRQSRRPCAEGGSFTSLELKSWVRSAEQRSPEIHVSPP